MELLVITDGMRLSRTNMYQIEGSFYRFLYSDPYARVDYPQYVFKPLGGQRRKANKVLNKRKLALKVYEVVGLRSGCLSICGDHIQMELELNLD